MFLSASLGHSIECATDEFIYTFNNEYYLFAYYYSLLDLYKYCFFFTMHNGCRQMCAYIQNRWCVSWALAQILFMDQSWNLFFCVLVCMFHRLMFACQMRRATSHNTHVLHGFLHARIHTDELYIICMYVYALLWMGRCGIRPVLGRPKISWGPPFMRVRTPHSEPSAFVVVGVAPQFDWI